MSDVVKADSSGESAAWPETRSVIVDDLTFDVDFDGPASGTPIVLLHGFPESNAQWHAVVALLADAGHRVIAPNLRGYSPGARPVGVENYAIERLVSDVVGLLDALDIERAHLVGHDWGGTIGWFAAITHPERFLTYTAVSTAHPTAMADAVSADQKQREALGYMKTLRQPDAADRLMADDWALLRELCHDLPRTTFDVHAALLGQPAAPTQGEPATALLGQPTPPAGREPRTAHPSARLGGLDAALNYYRAYDPRAAVSLGPCRIPTTFVWGEDDFAFLRNAAEATAEHVDAPYEFVPLPGVGHWISDLEAPTLAAHILRRTEVSQAQGSRTD